MITNKKIAIYGLAQEGLSAANYLGANNDLTIIDDKDKKQIDEIYFKNDAVKRANLALGSNYKAEKFDIVVHSAGIRPDNPKIEELKKLGAKITSPTKIFFDECPSQIIGVTGTKGKGTTSTLIYKMLEGEFPKLFLAGNIGTPMLDILPKLDKSSMVILELSSFQLMDLEKSPQIAVVLMVTSEHMDWHKNQTEYLDAKSSIVKYQTSNDFAVLNQDYANSKNYSQIAKSKVYFFSTKLSANGVYLKQDKIISNINSQEEIAKITDIYLPGAHNIQNVCAAITVAKILNVDNEKIRNVVKTFKGLEHRLQLVRVFGGAKYYNDSFSTTPETTIAAIEAFKNPKVLILGGSSKKSDFSLLIKKIVAEKTIKALILIGIEGARIYNLLKLKKYSGTVYADAKSMNQIVALASKIVRPQDIVLLSPACASFDMFKNYKDRGYQFIEEVNKL